MKRRMSAILLSVCLYAQGNITTIAGGAPFVFNGQNRPAIQAPLGSVTGVAVDAAGNVYLSDAGNALVLKVSSDGILTVVTSGITYPGALARDSSGNLYVLDQQASGLEGVVRKVDATGAVTLVNAGPLSRASGLAVDSSGNLFIADTGNAVVKRLTPSGAVTTVAGNGQCAATGDGGPATQASLCEPYGLAVDSTGNLYIGEFGNSRIRKVTPQGVISTVAGNGTRGDSGDGGPALQASISWPIGLAVDGSGNLYISDAQSHRVRRVAPNGTITTFAGNGRPNFLGDGGPAASSALNQPQAVAVDASGNVLIADTNNSRVRRIVAGVINTIAGNGQFKVAGDGGPATAATLNVPAAVALDAAGNLYISDTGAHRIRRVAPDGIISTFAGNGLGYSGDGGAATAAWLNRPSGLAFDSPGNLLIADAGNGRIRRVDRLGVITTVAGGGTASGSAADGGPATNASLNAPQGIAVDSRGNMYIAEALSGRVRVVNPLGVISTLGFSFLFPAGVALDSAGNLYVTQQALGIARRDGGVVRISPEGQLSSFASSLIRPAGLAPDNSGRVFITDPFDHLLYRSSQGNNQIIAGTQLVPGFTGDGGPASAALLSSATGLALDPLGNLYVADSGNARVRKIAGAVCAGVPEPSLTKTLQPGFYIGEVRNAPNTRDGYWGMEVLVSQGVLAGGFNLGGAAKENNGPPAFGAFYVPGPQRVTITVNAQVVPGGNAAQFSMTARLLDAGRQPIGTPVTGTTSVQFDRTLAEGFYILEVRAAAGAPRATFQTSLSADSFAGGVNVGGFVSQGLVGFGAFYVPEAQEVTIRLFGPTYGSDGASCVQLTLLDASRNVIARAP